MPLDIGLIEVVEALVEVPICADEVVTDDGSGDVARLGEPLGQGDVGVVQAIRPGGDATDLLGLVPQLTEADLGQVRDLYDSEVAYTDHHVGRLLDGLRERGRYEAAVVVLTSDHGEELLERTTIGHGQTLNDELIHVPLILKRPGALEAGTVVDEPVGLVDVLPTLMQLLDLPVPEGLGGRTLLSGGIGDGEEGGAGERGDAEPPMATLARPRPRPVFSEASWPQLRSVVDGRFKLVQRSSTGVNHLFHDLEEDPGERSNWLAHQASHGVAADFARAERKLLAWAAYVESRAEDAEEVEIDPELRRELEALGYLQCPAVQ